MTAVPQRLLSPLLGLALVLAAVCGYVLGSHRGASAGAVEEPPSSARTLSSAGLLLEYPLMWQQTPRVPSIPGLQMSESQAIESRREAGTGLLVGRLGAGEPAPLPAAFVAGLSAQPRVEVVELLSTQAYRYSELKPAGSTSLLDLYVIPQPGSGDRVLGCFAARPSAASEQCERVVSGATLTGAQAPALTPEPTFAKQLSSLVASLDADRARARAQMSASQSPPVVGGAASKLGAQFSSVATSVSGLETPQIAAPASGMLASALRGAGEAYEALAAAAAAEQVASYDSARARVVRSEAAVDAALEDLVLLGYGPT